jgi:hypothetical protein
MANKDSQPQQELNELLLDLDDDPEDTDESSSSSTRSTSSTISAPLIGYLPPHKLLPHILNHEKRLLPRILYTLMTGLLAYELSDQNQASDRSKILASYGANDLIIRAVDPAQVGLFTRTVDFLLEHGRDTETREILFMFCVSTLRQYSRIKHADEFLNKFALGLQLKTHDLVFIMADNVQLQRPEDHSYSHWFTLLSHNSKI